MKRKTIFILAGFLIVSIAAFFYIDNIFLPIQFKRFITSRARQFLHREVSVGSIDFRLLKGFVIENVTIARKDDPNRPFIRVRQIGFNLLLAPIFQKQALIIPFIKIKEPYIYVARDENRVWNFSDLPDLGGTMKENNTFSVLLRKLDLEGGEITYVDRTLEEGFSETITNINIDTTLSLNKGIRFVIQAQMPEHKTSMTVKGNYTLITRNLTAQAIFENVHLARYLPLSYKAQPYIRLNNGVITAADFGIIYKSRLLEARGVFSVEGTELQIGEDRYVRGPVQVPGISLTWQDGKWNAKGRLRLPAVDAIADGNKAFRGNVAADLNLLTVFSNNITAQGDITVKDALLSLGEDNHFSGNIIAANTSLVKGDGRIRLQGNFDFQQAEAAVGEQAAFKGALSTKDTKLTWSVNDNGDHVLDVHSGITADSVQFSLADNRSMTGNISIPTLNLNYARDKIAAEATGRLEDVDIHLTREINFHGSPGFNIYYAYNPALASPVNYKGTFRFSKGLLDGVPHLGQIGNIEGACAIMPDHIQTSGVTFDVQGSRIILSGLLIGFADPALNIKASSENIRLEKVLELFPVLRTKLRGDLSGDAAVSITYNGPAGRPSDAVIISKADLTNVTFTHDRIPDRITGVSGQLYYSPDILKWRELKGQYRQELYMLDGVLKDFSRPLIETEIVSNRLKLITQIKTLHSAFQLISCTGRFLNSSFDLKGDVHLFENEDADIDLRGNFTVDLGDIGSIIPRLKYKAEQLRPVGSLTGQGIYKGRFKDWRNWQLAFDAASDRIVVKDYPFESVSLRFTQRDQTISKFNVSSKVYGGILSFVSSADLREEAVPFTVAVDLKDLDFAQYRLDRKPKNRQLSGFLTINAALSGNAEHWREMTGEGSFAVTKGYLWQWNILDGISTALLIPEFKNFVFTDAHGGFVVRDQKVLTDNTQMVSQSVVLDAKGWVDFGTNLNFDIKPKFSRLAIMQSESMKKGPTSIITQTEGYLNIKLTGTLAKPVHRVEKFPLKIIEGTIGDTTDTLKEVIGGIVDEVF